MTGGEWTKARVKYLKELAEEYGVKFDIVLLLADMLGPNEDYDGLVTELEDYSEGVGAYTYLV